MRYRLQWVVLLCAFGVMACNVKDSGAPPRQMDASRDLDDGDMTDPVDQSDMMDMDQSPGMLTISVEPATLTLLKGQTVQLTAAVRDAQGAEVMPSSIQWSSTNDGILTVDETGLVTAVGVGQASIEVSTDGAQTSVDALVSMGDFQHVALGQDFICALDADRALWCWGDNEKGQLGNGALSPETRPVKVETPLTFASLYGGDAHICALTDQGQAYCWGHNDFNTLGISDERVVLTPTPVESEVRFRTLSTSRYRTCGASLQGNDLYCWGNSFGEQDKLVSQLTGYACTPRECDPNDTECMPVVCPPALDIVNVSAGSLFSFEHETNACGITTTGEVWCWPNSWGLAGFFGTTEFKQLYKQTPLKTMIQQGFTDSDLFSCGLGVDEKVYCWGNNEYGQLGTGNDQPTILPTPIDSDLTFTKVDIGYQHGCALTASGQLYCWGRGEFGALGTGNNTNRYSPTEIELGDKIKSFDVGYVRTCAITVKEKLYCWGLRGKYSIGSGYGRRQPLPKRIELDVAFEDVKTGAEHACALTDMGDVYCWGDGRKGQLATGQLEDGVKPTRVDLPQPALQVELAADATCALLADQRVFCWGDNEAGAAGLGQKPRTAMPEQVSFLKAKKLASSTEAMCVIDDEDGLRCWGSAKWMPCSNQLCKQPTLMFRGSKWEDVALGSDFACGLTLSTKQAKCWGENKNGQLGAEPLDPSSTPIDVNTTETFTALRLGRDTVLAQVNDNTLVAWGGNSHGQRLDDSPMRRATPLPVTASEFTRRHILDFQTSGNVSCVLFATEQGTPLNNNLYCQGYTSYSVPIQDELFNERPALKRVDSPFAWTKLSLSSSYGCAIDDKQRLYCWGLRKRGVLGNQTSGYINEPLLVEP